MRVGIYQNVFEKLISVDDVTTVMSLHIFEKKRHFRDDITSGSKFVHIGLVFSTRS